MPPHPSSNLSAPYILFRSIITLCVYTSFDPCYTPDLCIFMSKANYTFYIASDYKNHALKSFTAKDKWLYEQNIPFQKITKN